VERDGAVRGGDIPHLGHWSLPKGSAIWLTEGVQVGDVVALLLVVIAVAVIGFVGAAPVSCRLRRTPARAAVPRSLVAGLT